MEAPLDGLKKHEVTEQLVELIKSMPENQQRHLLKVLIDWQLKMKKRAHARKPVKLSVDYATKEQFYRDFTEDISASGLYIATRQSFAVGQKVSLTFTFPHLDKPFKINSEIARVDANGIGVKFIESLEHQVALIRYLEDSG